MQGVKLGYFTLAAAVAAAMAACSDPESTPNGTGGTNNGGSSGSSMAGTAGSGMAGDGTGGTAGGGGTAGAGGSSGAGGTGQGGTDADAGGDGGNGPPCTGCVEIQVPVDGENQTTLFQFSVGNPPKDMSNAVITFRMRALTIGDQLTASPFAQDDDFQGFQQDFRLLNAANGFVNEDTWVDRAFDLASLPAAPLLPVADAGADAGPGVVDPAAFNKARVVQFGLNVGAAGGFTGTATVTVLLDSVTFTGVDSNVLPDVTFDTGADGFAASTFQPRPGAVVIHHPL